MYKGELIVSWKSQPEVLVNMHKLSRIILPCDIFCKLPGRSSFRFSVLRSNWICMRGNFRQFCSFCLKLDIGLHCNANEKIPFTNQVRGLYCKLWTVFFPFFMA